MRMPADMRWFVIATVLICLLPALSCGRGRDDAAADERAGEEAGAGNEEHAEAQEVALTPEALARANLSVQTVEATTGSHLALAPAELTFDADRVAKVGPRVAGRVATLPVALGDEVQPGTVLATIDGPEIGAVMSAYTTARAEETLVERTLEREQGLFERKIAAEREVLDARAALTRAQATRRAAELRLLALGIDPARIGDAPAVLSIRAPIAGRVVERQTTLGAPVSPDDVLFTIADLSTLWLIVKVPETAIRDIRIGAAVTVALDALPDRGFTGRVSYIAPVVATASRTVDVRINVDNRGHELRPGMFARARLTTGAPAESDRGAQLLVPRVAVQTLNGRTVVFMPDEPGRFRIQEVVLGRTYGADVEILGGLAAGDQVVTVGSFTLKAEAVRGAVAHPH